MSHASSARVITAYCTNFDTVQQEAEQELQSTECLGRKDRILAELIQLTCSCQEGATGSSRMPTTEQSTPQSTAPETRLIDTKRLLQVTPYHGDKVSFLGWRWSFLIAVRAIWKPLYEGLKKIEDNMNQDF